MCSIDKMYMNVDELCVPIATAAACNNVHAHA